MSWLAKEFGIDRMRNAEVLLPHPDHFPDPYHGTRKDVESLMQRLCRHMRLDAAKLGLRIHPDKEMPDAAGLYEATKDGGAIIRIAQSQLANLEDLLATLSHELSHQLLLGEQRLTAEDSDHEMMTDLLPVFLGLGLFGANSAVRETMETSVGWHYWSIRRQGYLPARIYGYALALFAWLRGESRPQWAAALRLDARHVFWKSLKYLAKTEDSVFHPETISRNGDPPTLADLVDDLKNEFPSRRIVALWNLRDQGTDARAAADNVLETTTDREAEVRSEAISILPDIGADDSAAISRLLEALDDPMNAVRFAAVKALGHYAEHADKIVGDLTDALADRSPTVVLQATLSLAVFGARAQSASEYLVKPLRSAIIECKHDAVDIILSTLTHIHPDPDAVITAHFADDDPEFLRRARESLADLREIG